MPGILTIITAVPERMARVEQLAAAISQISKVNIFVDDETPRRGRLGYYRTYNEAFAVARESSAEWVYFLQDDVILCDHFFARTVDLFCEFRRDQGGYKTKAERMAINLHKDARPLDCPGYWGRQRRLFAEFPLDGLDHMGWTDCVAWMTRRDSGLFDLRDPFVAWMSPTSSGVPAQLSFQMRRAGLSIYRARKSYVRHIKGTSTMHARPTEIHDLCATTVDFIDGA